MEPTFEDLIALAGQVYATVCSMPVEPLPGRDVPVDTEVLASVQITGTWQGAIVVTCSRALADAVTAAMFGMDVGEAGQAELEDAMGEIANMIGGNIKNRMPVPSSLSLPTVAVGARLTARFPGTRVAAQALCSLPDGTVGVRVFRKTA